MKILVRVMIGLGLVLLLAVGALVVVMPGIVKSDAVRERIQTAARDALGRDVSYQELDFGIFPPSLLVVKPAVAGATAGAAPLVEAEGVALRVAVMPLLARTLVVDSLVIEGATLRLVRTEDGFELPSGGGAAKPAAGAKPKPAEAAPTAQSASTTAAEAGAGFSLALRGLTLRNSTIVVEDRAVKPAVTWELRNVDAKVRGTSLDAPLDVDVSAKLGSGGSLSATGTATLESVVDLKIQLDAIALAPARPYLGPGRELGGALSGKIAIAGPAANPSKIDVALTLADGVFRRDEIDLRGPLEVKAQIAGGLDTPTGRFEVDASAAALKYGEAFTKPPGTAATLSGRIVNEGGALGADGIELKLKNLDAQAKLRTGKRTSVVLNAAPFDIRGWEALLPALAEYKASGDLGFEALAITTEPLEVRGKVALGGIKAKLQEQGDVVLRGALVGQGNVIATEAMTLTTADQTVKVDGSIRDLAGTPRYRFRVDTEKADTNRLVSVFAGKPDAIFGPLNFRGDVAGSIGGEASALQTLEGNVGFDITDGRLVGVSLLKAVFDRFGAIGTLAQIAGQMFGGRDLQRFYGDEFTKISGTLDFKGGVARTNDFHIAYRDYGVDLRGTLGLTDLAIDMTGTITIFESVDAALQGETSTARATKRVIPLAAVGGTLDKPRVTLNAEAARTFASVYGAGKQSDRLKKVIDKELGDGAGGAVVDVLEGILGGGSRKR